MAAEQITDNGNVKFSGSIFVSGDSGTIALDATGIGLASGSTIRFSSDSAIGSVAADVGIKRSASGAIQITNGGSGAGNIAADTSTGLKIGTGATQKLGFYNATPVAQQATTGTTTGFTAGSGTASKSDSTFTGNSGSTAYTVGDVVLALKNLGFLAA